MPNELPIAISRCDTPTGKEISKILGNTLDKACLPSPFGKKILVKPNLLMNRDLACTNPHVVYSTCAWLKDNGAKVVVGDSPAFGNPAAIAKKIGLADALAPLNLEVMTFRQSRKIPIIMESCQKSLEIALARTAFEVDEIYSVPRVKAHSQLRMTLAVKNCFGLVPGVSKAFIHAFHGGSTAAFCDIIAGIFRALPPVRAVADGIIAMHVTGPSKGKPFNLSLLGACASPPALDFAILKILKIPWENVPLCKCFQQEAASWPISQPDEWNIDGFLTPQTLKPVSFSPWTLIKSLCKRMMKSRSA